MSFADTYLKRYASGWKGDLNPIDPDASFCIIIPVYGEGGLLACLRSLLAACGPGLTGEVILLFNYPEGAPADLLRQHAAGRQAVESYVRENPHLPMPVHVLDAGMLPAGKAGPGLARKIGMDLAVRRFNSLNRPDGILISMDADTLVADDFLPRLTAFFASGAQTCTGYFEHLRVFNGEPVPDPEALILYEIYLRMVKTGLQWAGYPHAFHSLGSNFSVTAQTYVRAGGMGVQQSGEDFYFLHKCIPLGRFYENNQLRVFPSGRASDRVVFGTGPFIRDFASRYPEGFKKYSWEAFRSLAAYLTILNRLTGRESNQEIHARLGLAENEVTQRLGWQERVLQACQRAGNQASFKKWIWRELNGLQMVRYLNEHQQEHPPDPILHTAGSLLHELRLPGCTRHPVLVLQTLRRFERSGGVLRIS